MNPKEEKILPKSKKMFANSSKLANISRISPPVSLRPIKKVLEKSKFYKPKASFYIFTSLSPSKECLYT